MTNRAYAKNNGDRLLCSILWHNAQRLLVKPGTPEQRNTGTRNTGTPEQHHSGTRNTGTLKIINLLKIRKKNTGGCESIAAIIIAYNVPF